MRIRRAHVQSLDGAAAGGVHRADAALRHYLAAALRARPGERFLLFDREREAEAALRPDGDLDLLSVRPLPAPAGPAVTLLLPLMKGPRLRDALRQSVEVGLDRVVPVECARSVREVRDPERLRATLEAVAGQAAQQCGARPPLIEPPARSLAAAIAAAVSFDIKLYLDPAAPLHLDEFPAPAASWRAAALATGPEGGFDDAERAALAAAGFLAVRLRTNVLRCETAPPVAVALVRQHFRF